MFNFKDIFYEYRYEPIEKQLVRFNKHMMIFQIYDWDIQDWHFDTIASDVAFWTTKRFFEKITKQEAEQIILDYYEEKEAGN